MPGSVSQRRGLGYAASLFEATELCDQHLQVTADTPSVRPREGRALGAVHVRGRTRRTATSRGRPRDRAAALGGAGLKPGGGRAFDLVRDAAGWKAAVRFQSWWYRVRYGR